ncbi:MAG: dihydroneopterin aldolase [Wolbachia endosymbiont of Xenopsylla cheopis]
MQKIRIKNLPVYAKIGCYNWEKVITQKLLITVIISINVDAANISAPVVDYYEFSQDIKSFAQGCECNFLEEMAKKLLDYIMLNDKILHCYLQILKPSALDGVGEVSVIIEK